MATILKSKVLGNQTTLPVGQAFNLEDVAAQARSYIEAIREQSQKMIDEAQRECIRLREEAKAAGLRDGETRIDQRVQQTAAQIADERVLEASQTLQAISENLEQATHAWLRQWQHETVLLAIGIAEKLVQRQIEADPNILIEWIQQATDLIQNQRRIQLKIHPDEAVRLSSALGSLVDNVKPQLEIMVTEDPSVGKCGVIIETPDTTIDMTLKTQLERLKEELV